MKLLVVHCTRNEITLVVHCTRNERNADTHRTLYVEGSGQPLNCFLHVVLWSMVHGNADQPKLSIIVLAHETLGPVQISLQIAISHTIRSMPCEYLTTDRLRWTKRHPFGDLAGDQHLLTSCALSTVQFACCTMFALY